MNKKKSHTCELDSESVSVKSLLNASLDAAFLFNKEGELVTMNREALERLRKTDPKLKNKSYSFFIGKKFKDFYPADFILTCDKCRKSVLKTKKPKKFQYNLNGRILEIISYPVQDKNNPCCNFAVYSRDITTEVEAEKKLKKTNDQFKKLVEDMYVGYFIANSNDRITYINDIIKTKGGFDETDIIGKNIIDLFPSEERIKVRHAINKLKKNKMTRFESKFFTKNNEVLALIFSFSPIVTDSGEYNGMQVTTTDVTLLNETRDKLQYHIEFEKKIIEISSSFINLQFSEIDNAVFNALNIIGRFNKEEIINIYIINSDHKFYFKSHEWMTLTKHKMNPYPDNINAEDIDYILNILTKKDIIYYPDLTAIHGDIINKIMFTSKTEIVSCLIIPMFIKNDMIGFINIASEFPRHRTDAEISHFKMTADIIASAIERKSITNDLIDVIFKRLSEREKELITYISSGFRWPADKRSIGKQMDVLPGTLDKFMQRIKEKIRSDELDMIVTFLQKNKDSSFSTSANRH